MSQRPIVNLGAKYIFGLRTEYSSISTVLVNEGACRGEGNIVDITVDAPLSLDITKEGALGLDVGSVANDTMYAIYVLADSAKHSPTSGILSANFETPKLPDGYDSYRRVGTLKTVGLDIADFRQYGNGAQRETYYNMPYEVLDEGTATAFAGVDMSATVPPIRCVVLMQVLYHPVVATNIARIRPYNFPSTEGVMKFGYGVIADQVGMASTPSDLNSGVPTIEYRVVVGDQLSLAVSGFADEL